MIRGLYFGGTTPLQSTGRDEVIAQGFQRHADIASEDEPDFEYYNPQTGEQSSRVQATQNHGGAAQKKRVRFEGGIAAISKPVTADYDSDDARIMELKQQGYGDDYVSAKLVEEGRMRYVPRTIGSRYLRLRKALEEREEYKLDDELSDWHLGEDEHLVASFDAVEQKLDAEMQKLKDKKWKDVSNSLAERLRKKKYTANACKERYEALQEGNALLPIELDEDQAGRQAMREQRIAAAKAARAEEMAATIRVEEEKKKRMMTKKQLKAAQDQEKVQKRLEAEKDKAKVAQVKKEQKANRILAKAAKEAALAQRQAERQWKLEKAKKEKEVYNMYTGMELGAKPKRADNNFGDSESEEEYASNLATGSESGDESAGSNIRLQVRSTAMNNNNSFENHPNVGLLGNAQQSSEMLDSNGSSSELNKAPFMRYLERYNITEITMELPLNPRSILSYSELTNLLASRDLPEWDRHESHAHVVARVAAADETLKPDELNSLLRSVGENTLGTMADKVRRLQEANAGNSLAGLMGMKSTDHAFMRRYMVYRNSLQASAHDPEPGPAPKTLLRNTVLGATNVSASADEGSNASEYIQVGPAKTSR